MITTDTKMSRGDRAPAFIKNLKNPDGSTPSGSIPGSTTVMFSMRNYFTKVMKVGAAGSIVDAATWQVKYLWLAGDVDTPGTYEAQFRLVYADGTSQCFPSDGYYIIEFEDDVAVG